MNRPAWFPQIALRAPKSREVAGALFVVGLMAWSFRQGQHVAPVGIQDVAGPVRIVTGAAIAKQEPPAKPSIMHRATYKPVQPERVQVAPGAGRELLAAVCDTTALVRDSAPSLQSGPDTGRVVQPQTVPALVYAGKLSQPWHPWGAQTLVLFAVGPAGESVTDYRIHAPAEWRSVPVPVVREARAWRRVVKPLPFIAVVLGVGYVAGKVF